MGPMLTQEELEREINLAIRLGAICAKHGEAQAADHYAAVQRALEAELAEQVSG